MHSTRQIVLATLLVGWAGEAAKAASLMLTPAGAAQGFSLLTFATGFPTSGQLNGQGGPVGIAFTPGGGVLVSDLPGNVRLFPTDVDGQSAGSFAPAQNYGANNA